MVVAPSQLIVDSGDAFRIFLDLHILLKGSIYNQDCSHTLVGR